jgi:hypothetical protein
MYTLSPEGDFENVYDVEEQFNGEGQRLRIGNIAYLPEYMDGVVYVSVTGVTLDQTEYFFRGVLLSEDGQELGILYDPNLGPVGKRLVESATASDRDFGLKDPRSVYFRDIFGPGGNTIFATTWKYGTIHDDQAIILRELELMEMPDSPYGYGWKTSFRVKLGARLWSQHFGSQSRVTSNMGAHVEKAKGGRILVLPRHTQNLYVFEKATIAERNNGQESKWKEIGIRRWDLPGYPKFDPTKDGTAKSGVQFEIQGFQPVSDGFWVFYRTEESPKTHMVKLDLQNQMKDEAIKDGLYAGKYAGTVFLYRAEAESRYLETVYLQD